MQILLDHLAATVMATIVFFLLLVVSLRSSETSQDQTMYYASKKQAISFREMIEHDFQNIGWGVSNTENVFVTLDSTVVSFLMKIDSSEVEPSKVTYLRVPADTVVVDSLQIPLYEVQRWVGDRDGVDSVLTGSSSQTLTEFSVELRDAGGAQVTSIVNQGDVRTAHVRFIVVPPVVGNHAEHWHNGKNRNASHWNRTFFPLNLR